MNATAETAEPSAAANATPASRPRRAAASRQPDSMHPRSIRLPAALWERIGVAADANALNRASFVRMALARATRGAKS
jgi:hypothetical protein